MSTTNAAPATPPVVTNLHESRKAVAAAKRAHPAGKAAPAKKAPAKAAPAKATTTTAEKPAVVKRMWTATGRSGQAVHRMFAGEIVAALDVADAKATKENPRKGQIWNFYTDVAKAQAAADKLIARGYDAVVTTDVRVVK